MACWTRIPKGRTAEQRRAQVDAAIARLNKQLGSGAVKVKVGPQGAVAFVGWKPQDRDDVSDVCAYRKLLAAGSWELKKAQMAAEVESGRKVDPQAVAAGYHTHDGKSWSKH